MHAGSRGSDQQMTAAQRSSTKDGRIIPRATALLAWTLWVVATAVTVVAMVLVVMTRSLPRPIYFEWKATLLWMLAYLSFPTVGLIIAARRPANPLGWLFLFIGLALGLNDFLHAYADYALFYRPGALPGGLAVGWVSSWNWAIIFPIWPLVFLLFPDGRLPSRRWRPVAWAAGLCGGLVLLLVPFRAGPLEYFPTIQNPVGISWLTEASFAAASLVYFALLLLAASSLLARFRLARGDQRQQLKWVAFAAVLFGIEALVGPRFLPLVVHSVLTPVTFVAFNAAIAVAILKYRLYDIDRLINRTLVYGLLTAILAWAMPAPSWSSGSCSAA